jgi:hypothetical protein
MRLEREIPKNENRRFVLMGRATPGRTSGLTGTVTGLAREESTGGVFRQ